MALKVRQEFLPRLALVYGWLFPAKRVGKTCRRMRPLLKNFRTLPKTTWSCQSLACYRRNRAAISERGSTYTRRTGEDPNQPGRGVLREVLFPRLCHPNICSFYSHDMLKAILPVR